MNRAFVELLRSFRRNRTGSPALASLKASARAVSSAELPLRNTIGFSMAAVRTAQPPAKGSTTIVSIRSFTLRRSEASRLAGGDDFGSTADAVKWPTQPERGLCRCVGWRSKRQLPHPSDRRVERPGRSAFSPPPLPGRRASLIAPPKLADGPHRNDCRRRAVARPDQERVAHFENPCSPLNESPGQATPSEPGGITRLANSLSPADAGFRSPVRARCRTGRLPSSSPAPGRARSWARSCSIRQTVVPTQALCERR